MLFPCQIHDLDHPVSYQDKIQQNMVAEYIDLKNAVTGYMCISTGNPKLTVYAIIIIYRYL